MRVLFKCLSVEKLKVERKGAISEQMSDHPYSRTPSIGLQGPEAPTAVLCPTRVNPGRPGVGEGSENNGIGINIEL